MKVEKTYIGKVEAYELLSTLFGDQFPTLPHKGRQYVNVPSIASGQDISVMGKDEAGYYLYTYPQGLGGL